jgi:hypothetical protein
LSGIEVGLGVAIGAVGLALASRRLRRRPEPPPRFARDLAFAAIAGVIFAILASLVWVPASLAGSTTTGSDIGEHFRLLHALEAPGWPGWSANRYPLPALIAHTVCGATDAHLCWYRAAVASTGAAGAGIFLWGTALGGPPVGVAALILAGGLQDLVLMSHTVTGYPEILAIWCLAAGFSAYAVRDPSPWTCGAAGLGIAGVFASDGRGLMLGLATLGVTAVAIARVRPWPRIGLAMVLAVAPIGASWWGYSRLHATMSSLEQLVETSVEVSYTRANLDPPPRVQNFRTPWIWGRSTPADLPQIVANLRSARSRVRPGTERHPEQAFAISRMKPLWYAVAVLGVGIVLMLRDWRVWFGLAPGIALLSVYQATMSIEYHTRYAALGCPVLLVVAALGLRGWVGEKAPPWVLPVLAALLAIAPGPFSWRDRQPPQTAPPELRSCLAVMAGRTPEVSNVAVDECVAALQVPLTGRLAAP